ncbi:MAG: bifunctional glutamine synthetase adenylyltransferase/deadenyltransferase [Betaproteobacteria bacterium RBG_16_58_11]|nr:MAG: bifunctional glutamine synthetase adenylyltransferase/deadenyltransferase [Betaproteobacteria bacterium RBG_16_58_11]OFZ98577.1 MAG: bifunctional glutamine synthetase adenylyltransferase/deadenyltransferase [Betaproteobacteria bacterium RBG_19FT_COMBO_58_11]
MPASETFIDAALRYSRYGQRLLAAEPALRDELRAGLDQPLRRDEMQAFLAAQPITDEASLKRALRALRKRVALRLMVRDLSSAADLGEVMTGITQLAEVTIQAALQQLDGWLQQTHGAPMGEESGARQELIVAGMGKLGGGELNVSSDVDLIYLYPEAGETNGRSKLSNHEYFTRLGQKLSQALSEITADGYVFRVDLRLRPYGESGPLVSSFAMLEQYFLTQGREWERYAWIKGRALSGDEAGLMELVRPFVYRKYLDYGAFASMRGLHAQIRREVARRELADNIKLGPGGIREIEFIAQVFQLIRGGKEAAFQLRPTRAALDLIAARNLLPAATVQELHSAYAFLRNLEHRLQYLEDAQTQTLPAPANDCELIAQAMGFADWGKFSAELDGHRTRVEAHFGEIFSTGTQATTSDSPWLLEDGAAEALATLGYTEPSRAAAQLANLKHSQRYLNLPTNSRARFDALLPRIIVEAVHHGDSTETLTRMITLMETISRRESYLALLAEYPDTLTHVARVCGASPWAADYLTHHPLLLDELLDTRSLMEKRDWPQLARRLREELGDFPGTERQMDTLRNFKHAQTFHLLAQDLEGVLPIETLSDELTALAQCVLEQVLRIAWLSLSKKHCDTPRFAVIGYGKLGGKELGYASDLDIIFLYDDPDQLAPETYARLAQRINSWLTTLTPAGTLYETDLRLRPDGAAGLLVSSVAAFEEYEKQKAWVWEHQALTRARFAAGDPAIGADFERIRRAIICMPREVSTLRQEVAAMRQKMRDAHLNQSDLFDLKHDAGGIVDVEFLVQFLVLAHASSHPGLADNIGNLALLARAADYGLVDKALAEAARTAYREFRTLQHRERMQGKTQARVDPALVARQVESVKMLWDVLLGGR